MDAVKTIISPASYLDRIDMHLSSRITEYCYCPDCVCNQSSVGDESDYCQGPG